MLRIINTLQLFSKLNLLETITKFLCETVDNEDIKASQCLDYSFYVLQHFNVNLSLGMKVSIKKKMYFLTVLKDHYLCSASWNPQWYMKSLKSVVIGSS